MDQSSRQIAGSLTASVIAQGGLSVVPLLTPVNAAFSDITTSPSSIPPGTYFYRVSATNDFGETLASAETSITTTVITSIFLKWSTVVGATGYKIYGRTSGAEQLLYTVVGGGQCSYREDNHSVAPSGALPTVNTTGGASFAKIALPAAGGADDIAGTATLVTGTVVVATTRINALSKVFFSRNTPGGTVGDLSAPSAAIVAGTSFVINSDNAGDTSTVNWWFFN